MDILRRQTATCAANTRQCHRSVPLCCASGATCIPLTGELDSVICCPNEDQQRCAFIATVACSLQEQNQTQFPYALLHTTNNDQLPSCGSGCCPQGYACRDNHCQRSSNFTFPLAATPFSTISLTATALPTSVPTSALGQASSTASASPPAGNQDSHMTQASTIAVGVVCGLFGLALIAIIFFLLRWRRRHRKPAPCTPDSMSSFGNPQPDFSGDPFISTPFAGGRSDLFMAQSASSAGSSVYTPVRNGSRFREHLVPEPLFGPPLPASRPLQRPLHTPRTPDTLLRRDTDESYISDGSAVEAAGRGAGADGSTSRPGSSSSTGTILVRLSPTLTPGRPGRPGRPAAPSAQAPSLMPELAMIGPPRAGASALGPLGPAPARRSPSATTRLAPPVPPPPRNWSRNNNDHVKVLSSATTFAEMMAYAGRH